VQYYRIFITSQIKMLDLLYSIFWMYRILHCIKYNQLVIIKLKLYVRWPWRIIPIIVVARIRDTILKRESLESEWCSFVGPDKMQMENNIISIFAGQLNGSPVTLWLRVKGGVSKRDLSVSYIINRYSYW